MVKIYGLDGNPKGEVKLPKVFSSVYRPDLIKRTVLVIQSHRRQPHGTNILAGKRSSAHYHGSRRLPQEQRMMNREMARMSRIHGNTAPGLTFRARVVPQAVKGRRAHPPKVEKKLSQKINNKERILAIKSAIATTANFDLVKRRHKISEIELPIIVSDDIQNIKKTKDLEKLIAILKLSDDLKRAKEKSVRSGRGKMRGRKYKNKKSILFVTSENKGIYNATKNLFGVDVCLVNNLNAELLAPGTQAGRLTVWSESAIKKLGEIYG
jgi:large subunit ribosomal protein L4e